MRKVLWTIVEGDPVGKGRPRFGRHGNVYTPTRTRDWEFVAAAMIRSSYDGPPLDGPVGVEIKIVKKRPKSMCKKSYPDGLMLRCTKPDGDNVEKSVLDALTLSGVIEDDSSVSWCKWTSLYSNKGGAGYVQIEVYR